MKVFLQRDGIMYVGTASSGTYYTFKKNEAVDFSNKTVEEFVKIKKDIEEREGCILEIVYE